MTGRQIKTLRETLGVDPFAFAAMLGVHVSTIYRWETTRATVRIDPLQALLLSKLDAHLTKKPKQVDDLHLAIVDGLISGGPLVALAAVLEIILNR